MRERTRWHVVLVIAFLGGVVYGRLTLGWNDLASYAGAAGLIALIGAIGLPWMELAPDGAWRRRRET